MIFWNSITISRIIRILGFNLNYKFYYDKINKFWNHISRILKFSKNHFWNKIGNF